MIIRPLNEFDGKGWLKHRDRPTGTNLNTIVLHATAGSTLAGAISTLRKKGFGYHYIIDVDGTVWKCCPMASSVAHAGESVGPQGSSVNRYSIGVCFVNLNDGQHPITSKQHESLIKLLPLLEPGMDEFKWLTSHYAITVKPNGQFRKSDPRMVNVPDIAEAVGLTPWKPSYSDRFSL